MKKPLVLSMVALTSIMGTTLNAESMYERFEAMEIKMQKLQNELDTLKNRVVSTKNTDEDEEDDAQAQADEEDDAQAKVVAANDTADEEDEDEEETDDAQDDTEADTDNADDTDDEEDEDEADSIEDQIADIQESITELNKHTNGSHVKFTADYRFSLDNLHYKMADGSTQKNDAFMTNRFWLNMNWKATENLSFRGQLAYNKAFGARSGANPQQSPYETFDWVTNENAYDGVVRVKNVYFLYVDDELAGADIPWTFSIGRRPSTNGHLINLRDDDHAASPQGHSINVEFDGLSAKFGLEDVVGVDGMYIKFCAGRGLTNAEPMFDGDATVYDPPFASTEYDVPDIDLAGLIFEIYNDGQYELATQYYYAANLIDDKDPTNPASGFERVGGMHSITASFMMNGIGDEISDYLDDTIFFVSGAMSITDPKDDKRMLYGALDLQGNAQATGESKTGYSVWTGVQMPSLISEDGKWGLEYNWGSQYWRSITYAEDTKIGSKVAARGSAYEAYFTEYLVEDILSVQLRYTYIDYDYTGSNGFFGATSGQSIKISDIPATNPMLGNIVDTAQDIRFYIRYKF